MCLPLVRAAVTVRAAVGNATPAVVQTPVDGVAEFVAHTTTTDETLHAQYLHPSLATTHAGGTPLVVVVVACGSGDIRLSASGGDAVIAQNVDVLCRS